MRPMFRSLGSVDGGDHLSYKILGRLLHFVTLTPSSLLLQPPGQNLHSTSRAGSGHEGVRQRRSGGDRACLPLLWLLAVPKCAPDARASADLEGRSAPVQSPAASQGADSSDDARPPPLPALLPAPTATGSAMGVMMRRPSVRLSPR